MRTNKVTKEELIPYLLDGLTTREIGRVFNVSNRYVSYLVNKYDLKDFLRYKRPDVNVDYFENIDTKEKAYTLGFLLADGTLGKDGTLATSIALRDKEIVDFIANELNANVRVYQDIDREKRKFPSVQVGVKIPKVYSDFLKLSGDRLKPDRRLPRINKKLEKYMVLGFFDADGCITWGRRKDRNRLWQKLSFTSTLKMLSTLQDIFLKESISTKLYKKVDCDCYILETTNKFEVVKILDYLYDDLIVLKRKYNNAQALRLELGELGEP